MDFVSGYDSDDGNSSAAPSVNLVADIVHSSISSAPVVAIASKTTMQMIQHDQKSLMNNPKACVVLAKTQGPAHPFRFNVAPAGAKQAGMGSIEPTAIEDWTFNEQYQTYQRSGFAMDSSSNAVLGDYEAYIEANGDTAQSVRGILNTIFTFQLTQYFSCQKEFQG